MVTSKFELGKPRLVPGPGKPRLVSGPGKPRPVPGPVRWKPEPNKTRDAGNNEGRHGKQGKGSTLSKKPGREEESDGDHKSRETTTIRVAVNDQNRSQVEKWLGDNDVGPPTQCHCWSRRGL